MNFEIPKEGAEKNEDFNLKHPEMKDDEVFLGNFEKESLDGSFDEKIEEDYRNTFSDISYQTKRRGITAYTIHGEAISELYPVFVKKDEWEKRHKV